MNLSNLEEGLYDSNPEEGLYEPCNFQEFSELLEAQAPPSMKECFNSEEVAMQQKQECGHALRKEAAAHRNGLE